MKPLPVVADVLGKTVKHFFPEFFAWLHAVDDPRNQEMIVYPREFLLWAAILIGLLYLSSRRQFRFEAKSRPFMENLNMLCGTNMGTVCHDDTIAYYLERLSYESLEQLRLRLVNRLIRMKLLDKYRLYGHFLIAIDGSGIITYRQRHCPCCLTQRMPSGQTIYYHYVLEAKLVTHTGLAISVGTEFVENTDPNSSKQDCELKAFYRLAKKLKRDFPYLRIGLLGDGLYACKEVFDICAANGWKFILTFKSGCIPDLFDEFERLKHLDGANTRQNVEGELLQKFTWVNDLKYEGHKLCVFECQQPDAKHGQYFCWITNFEVEFKSVVDLGNKGGRQRWKIENQGFNTQKNCGYNLEHAYSRHLNASKCFYIMLQIAHLLNQLMVNGSLLRDFAKNWGSLRNFARRLAESLRNVVIAAESLCAEATRAIQIRLNTS